MAISGDGWDIVPVRAAVAATGGANGLDARSTNAQSVRDCRLTDKRPPKIRVRSNVGLYRDCGEQDSRGPIRYGQSKNARRKAERYGQK